MKMPRLGMGTWGIGGGAAPDPSKKNSDVEILRAGLDIGYRLIDTAEYYGAGLTEEIVGEAIVRTPREELFIVSKVWSSHLHHEDVLSACDRTLKRLGTTYLDLYLIHWPNPEVKIRETLSAMNELREAGKIKAIGVSNFDMRSLQEALTANVPIHANQIEYSLGKQAARRDIIPFCKQNGIDVMAYRPLSRGSFGEMPRAIVDIARRHGATEAQIAIAWLLRQGICAIPKAAKLSHMQENWAAQQIDLSDEEFERLTS